MKTFLVTVNDMSWTTYRVDAASAEAAQAQVVKAHEELAESTLQYESSDIVSRSFEVEEA